MKVSEARTSMRAEHRIALLNVQTEAERIAATARLIAAQIEQLLIEGGKLSVQQQVMFLTGALARLQKDMGVLEHLQKHGAAQFRAVDVRK